MMSAAETVATIRAARGGQVVVTTMSGLAFWPEAGPRDFRLLGLMGAAASIGLGMAIARPDEEIWVIDGDGSLQMQLGVLAAVADARPLRYTHIVVDNRVYGVSGAQPLPAHEVFDWVGVALAAGYASATSCETAPELARALTAAVPGPRFIAARSEPVRPDYLPGAFAIDAGAEASRVRGSISTISPRR